MTEVVSGSGKNPAPDFDAMARECVRDLDDTTTQPGLINQDAAYEYVLDTIRTAYHAGMMRAAEVAAEQRHNGSLFSESYAAGYKKACSDVGDIIRTEADSMKGEA